jgi:hypothetical protein
MNSLTHCVCSGVSGTAHPRESLIACNAALGVHTSWMMSAQFQPCNGSLYSYPTVPLQRGYQLLCGLRPTLGQTGLLLVR